jgi:site-specific DNA-methyltransferase (adenine-specific)
VSSLDSTHAASQEPAPQWHGAGPVSVPARTPTTAECAATLMASSPQSTSVGNHVADELTAAILEQKSVVVQTGILHLEACRRLGELLLQARAHFPHHGGGWFAYLNELGIQQDRAQNYITLARYADSADLRSLPQDLTVTAALAAIRSRRQQAGLARHVPADQVCWSGLPDAVEIWEADAADTGLPDGAVHGLILFSPPYGVGLTYQSVEDCNWTLYSERVRNWCRELWRIAADQTRIAVNVANDIWDHQEECPRDLEWLWKTSLYAVGFAYRCTIDWIDGNGHRGEQGQHAFGSIDSANAPNVINPTERIIVAHKGAWNLQWHEAHDLDRETRLPWLLGVWNIPGEHRAQRGHPAPFPEELVRRLVLLYSYPADTVYDPFVGSGTTPAVAHQLGRVAWGSDTWPLAVQLAQQRLARAA